MTACERCWRESSMASDPSREYHRLLRENACTPEEQAGPDATKCGRCERATCHQYTGDCMACGWSSRRDALRNAQLGTFAPAVMGGGWVKVEHGWKATGGATFPSPGGDWNGKLVPPKKGATS